MTIPRQSNTRIETEYQVASTPPLVRSPRISTSQDSITLIDRCVSPKSTQKAHQQYQNVKKFEVCYHSGLPIPKIVVSAPDGTDTVLDPDDTDPHKESLSQSNENLELDSIGNPSNATISYSPEETKHVYGNTPMAYRSTKRVYPPSVVPVYQYIGGITTTYITIDYLKRRPDDFLYICGNGPDMSWKKEEALPLHYVGNDKWVYQTHKNFKDFEYKLVLNKKIWETYAHKINKNNPEKITPYFI